MCGITFPPYMSVCRGCDEETAYFSNVNPDPDWQEQVAAIKRERGDERPVIPEIKGVVTCGNDGEFFIKVEHVVDSGIYDELAPDTIVKIGWQHFVILGLVGKAQEYWMRLWEMQPTDDDMAWLAEQSA